MQGAKSGPTPAGLAVRFGVLLCALLALPLAVVMAAAPPGVSWWWDGANAFGFLALACILLLFVYAGRPRNFPPFSGRFFANLHRDLGYLALLFTLAHVLILLVREPLLLEHLKLTAPWYMLAGLAAAVLTLVLVLSSITSLRRGMWRDYHLFRQVHGWMSMAIVALLLYHAWGSAFYLDSPLQMGLVLALGAAAVLHYLTRGLRQPVTPNARERHRDSARFSHLVSYGSAALLFLVVALFVYLHNPG